MVGHRGRQGQPPAEGHQRSRNSLTATIDVGAAKDYNNVSDKFTDDDW